MWGLYILMALLSASVVVKLAAPLLADNRGSATYRRDRRWALSGIVVLPLVALALYHLVGRPALPAAMAVFQDYQQIEERRHAALALQPTQRLLARAGEDIGALVSMGQINYRLGRYADAVPYLQQAVELAQVTGDWRTYVIATVLLETLMQQSNDVVTDEARAVIAVIQQVHPQSPIARHFMAVDMAQQGQHRAAVAVWVQLLSEGGPSIYWKKRVRERMIESQRLLQGVAPAD